MNDESLAEAVVDFANAIESAAVQLKMRIAKKFAPEETKAEKPSLEEISSLFYVDKTSDKGAYKTTSKTDNPNNPVFLKLQRYLKDHNNFTVLHGFKFWIFSNNQDIIGRRKKK